MAEIININTSDKDVAAQSTDITSVTEALGMYGDLAKAIVVTAAFVWEGAITLAKLMPGYTMHSTFPHLMFLLLIYPLVGIVLEKIIRRRSL